MNIKSGEPQAIVLFDGVCNFCDRTVNFIINRDSANYFRFAPLQSEVAKKLLAQRNLSEFDLNSVILIENDEIYTRSTAALRIAARLDGFWRAVSVFRLIPRVLRDFGYLIFAGNRYRLFGKKDVCPLPSPKIRARFLLD